jgi:predicted signal transduction protein with EAL and GGDEF domain
MSASGRLWRKQRLRLGPQTPCDLASGLGTREAGRLSCPGLDAVNVSLAGAEIAHRLRACLRPWDTVARHGGDEFTILVEQINGIEDAEDVARRIQQELSYPIRLGDHEVFTNVSIGIAPANPEYRGTDEILRDADTAMYRAKARGRSRYEFFTEAKAVVTKIA